MPNLYRATAVPASPFDPLRGDSRTDVIVIGGGFTGLSTALHLAQRGIAVTLLEAEEAGWGASGRNGGQINAGLKVDPDVVVRDFGADLGERMNALAAAAPAFVFNLIKRHGIECEARQNGTLRAAVGSRHAVRIATSVEQLARRGAPVEYLERDGLEAATGTRHYNGAMYDRRGGDLNPLSFARGLARASSAAGAVVHGGSRVLTLSAAGAQWRASCRDGNVTAPQVVIATNGYTDGLWPGLRRSVVPLFGLIAATGALPESVAAIVLPGRSVLFESGNITVYYRVDGGQRLLIGGRGPMRDIERITAASHLTEYAAKLWPAVRGIEWTHAWSGRLAITADHYPHVHELAPGVLACLGYNGRGVALATRMGAELARRIAHPSEGFDMPLTPIRALALHALWPVAVRAAIARGRIMDMLGM